MRKLSYAMVAAMLLATGTLLAKPMSDKQPSVGLSGQISAMLSDNSFSDISKDLIAEVRFTLNGAGQLVVLSVATDADDLERFVKSRLNYQKVNVSNAKEGKLYKVTVRIAS